MYHFQYKHYRLFFYIKIKSYLRETEHVNQGQRLFIGSPEK